jgi:hypothetical protein
MSAVPQVPSIAPAHPTIAIVLLEQRAHDTPHFGVERLCYPQYSIFVQQSDKALTRAMHEGWRTASAAADYAAYWFLHDDVTLEHGDVLSTLVEVLFSDDRFAQISPQFQSPHGFMECATHAAQPVPYLEPKATLIKASTIERIGFWDMDLTHGWGIDYDYGYRVRQAGLVNILTNRARIGHRGQDAVPDWPAFAARAGAEMHHVLTRKYGPCWERITRMRKVAPVILACDRDAALTRRFAESFRSVRDWMEDPLIVVDVSSSTKLSRAFLQSIALVEPKLVQIHSRPYGVSLYDSVQDAAQCALTTVIEESGLECNCLFLEDDVVFSSKFAGRLGAARLAEGDGFLTFYLPGDGFGSQEIVPERFYGTQCLLFSREAVELLAREREEMWARFPPGYDIRWSRFLASKGYKLYATERSYVQHLSTESRLHSGATHASNSFIP